MLPSHQNEKMETPVTGLASTPLMHYHSSVNHHNNQKHNHRNNHKHNHHNNHKHNHHVMNNTFSVVDKSSRQRSRKNAEYAASVVAKSMALKRSPSPLDLPNLEINQNRKRENTPDESGSSVSSGNTPRSPLNDYDGFGFESALSSDYYPYLPFVEDENYRNINYGQYGIPLSPRDSLSSEISINDNSYSKKAAVKPVAPYPSPSALSVEENNEYDYFGCSPANWSSETKLPATTPTKLKQEKWDERKDREEEFGIGNGVSGGLIGNNGFNGILLIAAQRAEMALLTDDIGNMFQDL